MRRFSMAARDFYESIASNNLGQHAARSRGAIYADYDAARLEAAFVLASGA